MLCKLLNDFYCSKISTEHMGSLLNIISSVCRHSATSLSVELVTSLAEVAVNELVGETENEAADLLIELCKIHCMQATGGLLTKYVLILITATSLQ